MALSARTPTGADTAGHVPEIWSQLTRDQAEKELVAWDATDHRWQVDAKLGDTVNIGVINNVTATEVVVGTKAASLDIATGTKIQLVMDQWFEAPVDIDDMTIKQSQTNWEAKARAKGEYSIGVKIDSTVCALISALNASSVQGSDGVALTDDLLLDIMELLDEADAPRDKDRFLILDPSAVRDMLTYDKFVASQYVDSGSVQNGRVANGHPVYGCNIRVTNNLTAATTGAYAVMMHRQAIASALQIESPWEWHYKDLHQWRFQFEALWGVKEIRDDWGIPFYTRKS